MKEYSKEMVTCMGTLSQLSSMELVDLVEAIERERRTRRTEKCKDKIRAAMSAITELQTFYDCLEIESEVGMTDIYLTDVLEALEERYATLC